MWTPVGPQKLGGLGDLDSPDCLGHLSDILFFFLFAFQSCRESHSFCSLLRAESFILSHLISVSLSLSLRPDILGERKILCQLLWPWLEAKPLEHPGSKGHCVGGKGDSGSLESLVACCRILEVRVSGQARA